MDFHMRPCWCFSVTTCTKVLSILLAIGSCLLVLVGVVVINKRDHLAASLDNVQMVDGIPYDAVGDEILLDPRSTYRVTLFGYEILIGGISGVVLAFVIYLSTCRAHKNRPSSGENQLTQFNSISN